MKDLLAAMNPMRNPVYASWERLNHRLIDTALRDPWFLQVSGGMMQGMLRSQRMYNEWLATVTGASSAAPDLVQRSKKEGA